MNDVNLASFTDILGDEIANSQESQPISISSGNSQLDGHVDNPVAFVPHDNETRNISRPTKGTGQYGHFRSVDEIDVKYRSVFSYPFFNLVQSSVIEDALYSDKSMVVCAPTGSGKTVVFEMAIVQLLMELEDKQYSDDFKIIYMAPVKALCTERLTEWYPKFTKLGLLCIAVTGDTDVDFSQLKPYRIIITTPEKWDMITRRWREHSQLVEVIKLFLIDEVHILNDQSRGPVLEAVVSRMKTIESSAQSVHRIEQLQKQYRGTETNCKESPPKIRFVAVSATVSNPDDVAAWLGTANKPAVYYKFGDESRPVKLKRIVEGYPCPEGTSIFKFDIILNYKLWPIIQKYHNGKPTLIFCNTRKSVTLTAETLSRELTVSFSPEQKAKLTALASTIKTKKLQMLVLSGVGCHHAGLLYEERTNIEHAFRNRDLPILITTTTLAMGVNLPAHLVIIKNTQQYVNGAYQEYSISTILQMVGRAGRPQYDTEATAVIMTRLCDKQRYQALVGGSEPLQSYLHKRLAENLNSEAALGTVNDVAQCVQWVRSTFLNVRAASDPKRYLGLPQAAPQQLITKKIEELCVKAMNGLASSGLITMDEASCIESTEAGRLMSVYYLDLETMKHIMKINGDETLERLLWIICESHELSDMHLRVDERRCLNTLNRNNAAAIIRFPMKGKISTRQMKLNCIIQAVLGCLNIPDPSLNQEAMKIMRIADRICKCVVSYVTRRGLISQQPAWYSAVLNALLLAKCVAAHLWENSPYVTKQLKGIGATFSTLLATAGKVDFMLLEETHPRDLERIMNKGPPAGNILRKQISLLPKYQLTITPVDEKSVTIQLALLNQTHLSENMEQLTAGENHKSYVLVGDSENNILLLTSFKDKDLTSVYDGVITHRLTRKHNFEHKLFVHCISSRFVGIDTQCEYLFKDLESPNPSNLTMNKNTIRKPTTKQTNIPDTFKVRKRKIDSENDVTQSKEKKKRDNALLEKLKSLKESFGKTSKELREDLDKSTVMSNKFLQEFTQLDKPISSREKVSEQSNKTARIEPTNYSPKTNANTTEKNYNDEIDDEKIQNILMEIENEISKSKKEFDLPRVDFGVNNTQNVQSSCNSGSTSTKIPVRNNNFLPKDNKPINNTKKYSHKNKRSNYNFLDLLNKNMNMSDEEDEPVSNEISGFSNTIKGQIEKYLQNTKKYTKVSDNSIADLLEEYNEEENKSAKNSKVESEVQDFNVPISVSKVDNQTNALHNQDINGVIEVRQENESIYEGNKNIHELETETIAHLLQSYMPDTNKPILEGINNNCLTEAPNHCLDLDTNPSEKLRETQSSSPITNDKNQKQNNYKFPILYDEANAASDNNEAMNSSINLLPYSDNSHNENRTAQNTIGFPTALVPYTTQYDSPELPDNFKTQRQIICQGNTENSRTSLLRKQPEIYDSKQEQIVISSEYSPDSNNIPKPYNQNSNIRKYSYSATQIDVATRENHVTVIRKIKMDVDITEISGQNNRGNNRQDIKNSTKDDRHKHTQDNRHKYNINYPEIDCIDFEVLEPHEDKENKTAIMPYYRQQNVNNSKKDERQCYIVNPEIKCIDFKILDPHVETENTDSVNNELPNKDIGNVSTKQDNEEPFLLPKLITPPLVSHTTLNLQSKQTALMACHSNKKVDDVAYKSINKNEITQKESNRLGSILQKYSKILRKDHAGNLSQTPSQSKANEDKSIKAITEKPKRPFKITDIDHFKTPLTKLQLSEIAKRENIDETLNAPIKDNMLGTRILKTQNQECIYSQEELQNENIPKPGPKETWQDFSSNALILNYAHNEDIAENIEEELSKCELQDAASDELEPCTEMDFNIHQSMFNPKTLLQCFTKDESEIFVPPPPEFCDTELTPQHDVKIPMDCYEPMHCDIFSDNSPIESLIQDDFNIELTPRKEIETWTFSQHDESNQNLAASASFNTRQSFTIMHTPRQRGSSFQSVSLSKRNKLRLEQYKISPKKVLKK